jgi:hypothetical protein
LVRLLPEFTCEMVTVGRRGVIVVNVASGNDPPYGVGTSERDIRYHVRRGGTTFPAAPADVRAFVQARISATPATYFPSGSR